MSNEDKTLDSARQLARAKTAQWSSKIQSIFLVLNYSRVNIHIVSIFDTLPLYFIKIDSFLN